MTRAVPNGQYLYTGADVDYGKTEKGATSEMKDDVAEAITPKANSKLFGVPLKLHIYSLFKNEHEKGLSAWIQHKVGQAPVLFDAKIPPEVENVLINRMNNNGYFDATAYSEVDSMNKKAKVIYHLSYGEPYRIGMISHHLNVPALDASLDQMPASKILRTGEVYRLENLTNEAARTERLLREDGFYGFSRNYLKFIGDSTIEGRQINLDLELRAKVPEENLVRNYVSRIEVYPEYTGTTETDTLVVDQWDGISFHFPSAERKFRMKPLAENILFRPGDVYSLKYHYNTLNRLVNLNCMSYVNAQYVRIPGTDSLRMDVFLTPKVSQNISGSIGIAYKNSQYIGPEVELNYTHRNLFKGAEYLKARLYTNLNFPTKKSEGQFYEKTGAEISVAIPDLRIPFYHNKFYKQLSRARTIMTFTYLGERVKFPAKDLLPILKLDNLDEIVAQYPDLEGLKYLLADTEDFENRIAEDSSYAPFVGLNAFEVSYGYQWQFKPEIIHELYPISLGLQVGTFQDDKMEDLLVAYFLIYGVLNGLTPLESVEPLIQLKQMVYLKPSYGFTYDSRKKEIRADNYFYHGSLSLLGVYEYGNRKYPIPGLDRLKSTFLQITNDFRYFHYTKKNNALAFRLIIDVAYPFGDELFLPYFSYFTVGGPNSVRAFSVHELGPGSVQLNENEESILLLSGRGNIHLETSLEYRLKLTSFFELAAFADAGNVWVSKSSKQEANFRFNTFYKQLGLGTGLGFRLNFNPLLLRLDIAFPLTKPWLDEGARWVGNQINIGNPRWRKDNLQWNIAFGYPF